MTKKLLALSLVCLFSINSLRAQMVYDMDFMNFFSNMEYDRSDFNTSRTIFGLRVTPYIGIELTGNDVEHKFMGGLGATHYFGNRVQTLEEQLKYFSLWYNLKMKFGDKRLFQMYAGVIPTKYVSEYWSNVFISDRQRLTDPTFEGMLFILSGKNYSVELGCDWDGYYGATPTTREAFSIFSAGHRDFSPIIRGGYNAYMRHYACSPVVNSVVDNIMIEPYLQVDLSRKSSMDELKFKLGYIQSLQRERRFGSDFLSPALTEFAFSLSKYKIRLDNRAYFGGNIIPFYKKSDEAGIVYGTGLYHNEPFFALNDNFYDRLELSWMPYISKGMELKLAAIFHFHRGIGLSGSQQTIIVRFNLQELLNSER